MLYLTSITNKRWLYACKQEKRLWTLEVWFHDISSYLTCRQVNILWRSFPKQLLLLRLREPDRLNFWQELKAPVRCWVPAKPSAGAYWGAHQEQLDPGTIWQPSTPCFMGKKIRFWSKMKAEMFTVIFFFPIELSSFHLLYLKKIYMQNYCLMPSFPLSPIKWVIRLHLYRKSR